MLFTLSGWIVELIYREALKDYPRLDCSAFKTIHSLGSKGLSLLLYCNNVIARFRMITYRAIFYIYLCAHKHILLWSASLTLKAAELEQYDTNVCLI
jgi:hypothetical protein